MVNEEIYVLTKHARFQSDYIEDLPIYRRRYYLHLLDTENKKVNEMQEKVNKKFNKRPMK